MFCGRCGAKNDDDAIFCASCGSKLGRVETPKPMKDTKMDSAAKYRRVGIVAVSLVAVLVIILFVGFNARSYNKVIETYVEGSTNADVKSLLDLYPKKIRTEIVADEGYESVREFIKEEKESMQSDMDEISGVDWDIKHRVISVEDVTDEELIELKKCYKNDWRIKVSKAKTAYINIDMVVDGQSIVDDSMELSMVKIGRSWYVDYESMGSPF